MDTLDFWDPDRLREMTARTVVGLLDVEIQEASADRVVLTVPVTWKVHQPAGLLHGGVSALLAETAASIGGAIAAAPTHTVVGIELSASHLRSMRDGVLRAVAVPVRKGRTIQVWSIDLDDSAGTLICTSRCTLAVIPLDG